MSDALQQELLDAGKAIGLLTSGGGPNADWFHKPSAKLSSVFSDPDQRAAFLDLLDQVVPPANITGLPAGEKWHPLLGNQPLGNLYLTVNSNNGAVIFGLAGDISGGSSPKASLRAHLPVVKFTGQTSSEIAGKADGPLSVTLRVELNLAHSATSIGLKAIRVEARLSPAEQPPQFSMQVMLEGLELDGSGAKDTPLDAAHLGAEAAHVIIGLIHEGLRELGGAAGEAGTHLMPLFGISNEGIPLFPFTTLLSGPAALQGWLNSLVSSGKMGAWLGHWSGLFGGTAVASQTGTPDQPSWNIKLLALDSGSSELDLTLTAVNQKLQVGLRVSLVPGASVQARLEGSAVIAAIPLAGMGSAGVLPSASLVVRAPGAAGTLVSTPMISADSLAAGLRWNGSSLQPMLELLNVTLTITGNTAHYDRIDLTNADSTIANLVSTVLNTIVTALGGGPGQHLAALAGLVKPAGDGGWTHLVDPAKLVSNPTGAIADVHRSALTDATHHWGYLLGEVAALAGLAGPVAGTGAAEPFDPWRVPLASDGPLNLEVIAWNAQTTTPADPKLRIGLRLSAASAPWQASWVAELLSVDLPASGSNQVSLMGGQHASVLLSPVPTAAAFAGMTFTADSVGITMDWTPGQPALMAGVVNNIAITELGHTTPIGSLHFPPAKPFDLSNPGASIGISVTDLETVARLLVARAAYSWADMPGLAACVLLGIHGNLPGLQNDWPAFADPGSTGVLFADPLGALRDWLGRVAVNVSADGSPFLPATLDWLRALLADSLPTSPTGDPPMAGNPLEGSGVYEDPWRLPLAGTGSRPVELLAWLDPAGPPATWAAPLPAAIAGTGSFQSLLAAAAPLARFLPQVRDALAGTDLSTIPGALDSLAGYLATSDGLVPLTSQIPTGGTWTSGSPVNCAHHLQPGNASAVNQILNWIGANTPANARAVLLLGPAFSDHTVWQTLLTQAGAANPGTNFNLRVPNVDPASIDLTTVTAVADYYTADLQDNGKGDPAALAALTAQIGLVVARIRALRGGINVVLVAHSTAGVAARAYAAANPSVIAGLITLGTPHLGAPLDPLKDPTAAGAVRFIERMAPALPAGPVADAIGHLRQALDSYLPPPAANALPIAAPYPVGSFASAGTTDTNGVPALALGGTLGADLFTAFRTALGTLATTAAGAATPAPTHLAFAVRAHLGVPSAAPGDVAVEATIRVDAGRVVLSANQPKTPVKHTATVMASLTDPSGWLAGGPNSFVELNAPMSDVRVRWAELGVTIAPAGGGGITVTPVVRLHQAAFHGPTAPLVELSDVAALPLLGAVLHAVNTPVPSPASPVGALLTALTNLGLAVPDAHGGVGISADAFAAVQVDPAGYLAPNLLTALAVPGGLLGFSGPAGGPWILTAGPVEIYLLHTTDWEIGVRVPPPAQLTFGRTAGLSFDATLAIPPLAPSLDLSFNVAATTLTVTSGGQISISAPPWLDPLALPPTAGSLKTALEKAIPRILLSSAVTAFFEAALGRLFRVAPIDKLLSAPGNTLKGPGSLGNGSGLDSKKIDSLLQTIGAAAGTAAGPGLGLPAGLRLTATGTDPVKLSLATSTAIGNVLGFSLDAKIDSLMHVTPGGSLTLTVPVPAPWNSVTITFAISAAGLTLQFAPEGIAPIQLLPTFSGLGSLAGSAATLLPAALDALAGAPPASQLLTAALTLADTLDLRDGAAFAHKSDQWKLLLQGNWWAVFSKSGAFGAIATAISKMGTGLPGTVSAQVNQLTWAIPLSSPASGTVSLAIGTDGAGPTFSISADQVKVTGPNGGPLQLGFSAGAAGDGTMQAGIELGFNLQSLGIEPVPILSAKYTAGGFAVDFLPLGPGTGNQLDVQLLPKPGIAPQTPNVEGLIEKWLMPLAAQILFNSGSSHLNDSLWAGGPKLGDVLKNAGLVDGSNKLVLPPPPLSQMVPGVIAGMVSGTTFDIPNTQLHLSIVSEIPTKSGLPKPCIGVRLFGHQDISAGDLTISLRFGETVTKPSWITSARAGITIYLFDTALTFHPRLSVAGLGVDFAGSGGPLINTSFLRTGQIGGYLFFDVDFAPSVAFSFSGAGVEIDQFGIPLGQALGGGAGGNPVAAGLLQSSGGGDPHPVNPAVDVIVYDVDNNFKISIQNQTGALWLGIHQKFGPIYIDQLGLEIVNGQSGVAVLVDGSVQISGLTVQADELGVTVPLHSLASPGDWSLDLHGLAVSYDSSGVSIAGGLLKNGSGASVEYDGMLKVEVAGKGFTAVGAYAEPTNGPGTYTSLFIFVAVPIVLGGPPFFFVTGLGGGAGVNRRLLAPTDVTQVPNFLLVAAIDDSTFANDPMGALKQMALNIPARRGSYWFAAGVRFDSFVLVHSIAVIYVALDGGFEIGVLGVSRMALPTASLAIASVELALKARFSTAEGILSVQAQLTDNSYIFSKDCQLTGGFAFFTWFTKGQFLITIGGYHPAFQKPPEFPTVPRLGFHWSVSDVIVIKGEAYFALTNSCVMAGGRLEVTAHLGPVRAWLIAYADFLISWDPFHYDIDIGVSIGVALDFDICFIVCGHVHIEVSLGASLHIIGPPLHGEATVEILFFTITIPFGDPNASGHNYIQDFGKFSDKYLSSGDADKKAVGVRVTGGLLPPDPPGAKPTAGSQDQPWQLSAEFSFISETRMPASTFTTFVSGASGVVNEAATIDLAAMDRLNVPSDHAITILRSGVPVAVIAPGTPQGAGQTYSDNWAIDKIIGLFPEATWRWTDPDHMPAAAHTLPAISGLNIQGVAVLEGQSQLIPIGSMVDDPPGFTKPLPFSTFSPSFQSMLLQAGSAAEQLSLQVAQASSQQMLAAAEQVLTGNNFFAGMRTQSGVPAQGISPMATRSLRRYRSAPPLVAPLTTGLTMKPVGLAAPPPIYRVPESKPVDLRQPRLRAVLQARPQAASDAPGALHTTVVQVKAAARAPRMMPPPLITLAGSLLHLVPAPRAVRPTAAAISPRSLHNPEIGLLPGLRHAAEFAQAAKMLTGDGVTVPSGTTHVWDLPAGALYSLTIAGNAAVRLVAMNRGGHVLSDREMMPQPQPVPLPAETVILAIQCLGKPPQPFAAPAPGFGAISFAAAPQPGFPAVGWQSGSVREQVGPLTLLGRGASLRLGRTAYAKHRRQKASQAMVRTSRATLDQDGIETILPRSTTVVMVMLDGQDPTAAAAGDLSITVDGATLATPPFPVGGGRRRALLYDVAGHTSEKDFFIVAVGSLTGWQVSGVAGLHGTALEWATRMHGDVPERVVPEGPLTPDGAVRVRLTVTPATPPGSTVPSPLVPAAPVAGLAPPGASTPRPLP